MKNNKSGFSLVELSIVIVIIGLLIAGVAVGTSMIKQARLKSVIQDLQKYQAAYNNFYDAFGEIPGDMPVAFSYWDTKCAATSTLCNGNANGVIDFTSDPNNNETNKAWNHLSQASMIEAGIVPVTSTLVTTIGTSAPLSKLPDAGYIMISGTNAAPFETSKNVLFVGKQAASTTLLNSSLSAQDAFSIDQKIDDAVVNGPFSGATTGLVRSVDGNDATANACVTASFNYNITSTQTDLLVCRLGIALS